MFKSLKNALGLNKDKAENAESELPATRSPSSVMRSAGGARVPSSEFAGLPADSSMQAAPMRAGQFGGKPWRIEQGKPSRDFIKGLELRGRGEMALNEDVAVMILSRSLKDELDRRAFALYTDTLQTQVDPHLPEEMRWLSMYEEVGWETLGDQFISEYAILADDRENAAAWVQPEMVRQLLAWPSREPGVPRVMMILRGKVYLRMQINPGDQASADHAQRVFTTACELGIGAFGSDV
jgi:hypothetical protein